LITDLWEFVDCYLKEEEDELGAISRKIVISSRREIGWILYDVEDRQDLPFDGSAIVGRLKANELGLRKYHILILRRVENHYKRGGTGIV
jgi:hypothetical protein